MARGALELGLQARGQARGANEQRFARSSARREIGSRRGRARKIECDIALRETRGQITHERHTDRADTRELTDVTPQLGLPSKSRHRRCECRKPHARHARAQGPSVRCTDDQDTHGISSRHDPRRSAYALEESTLPGSMPDVVPSQGFLELAHELALIRRQMHRRLDHDPTKEISARPPRTGFTPLSRRRKTRPDCVSAGILMVTSPSSVGTASAPPSAAVAKLIGSSQLRCSPSRSKIACSRTWISTYRSPAGPPLRPASPSPLKRMRSPVSTPAGTLTASFRYDARDLVRDRCRRGS